MPKLPIISGQDLLKLMKKIGYELDHQTGSHLILRNKDYPHRRITIPNQQPHPKGRGMLEFMDKSLSA